MNISRKVTDETACQACSGWGVFGVSYSDVRPPIYHECEKCHGTGSKKPPDANQAALPVKAAQVNSTKVRRSGRRAE